jgi:hypothetical protein
MTMSSIGLRNNVRRAYRNDKDIDSAAGSG